MPVRTKNFGMIAHENTNAGRELSHDSSISTFSHSHVCLYSHSVHLNSRETTDVGNHRIYRLGEYGATHRGQPFAGGLQAARVQPDAGEGWLAGGQWRGVRGPPK